MQKGEKEFDPTEGYVIEPLRLEAHNELVLIILQYDHNNRLGAEEFSFINKDAGFRRLAGCVAGSLPACRQSMVCNNALPEKSRSLLHAQHAVEHAYRSSPHLSMSGCCLGYPLCPCIATRFPNGIRTNQVLASDMQILFNHLIHQPEMSPNQRGRHMVRPARCDS